MARPKKEESAPGDEMQGNTQPATHVVVKPFSDNPAIQPDRKLANRYQAGDDVSHLDADRLKYLASRGYVKSTGQTSETE